MFLRRKDKGLVMDCTLTMAASGLPAGKELGNHQVRSAFEAEHVAIPVLSVLYGKRGENIIDEEDASEMTPWLESWTIKVQEEISCRITEREEWDAYLQARDGADWMSPLPPPIRKHDMDLYQYSLDDLFDLQDKLRELESAVEDLGACTSEERGRILSEAAELKDRLDRTSWHYEFEELTEEMLDQMEMDSINQGDYPEHIKAELEDAFRRDSPTDEELDRMYEDYLDTLASADMEAGAQ
jgi:hypothetical protein